MKKRKILLLLLFVIPVLGWAQNDTQRLVVWLKSGEKVYFDLTEEPRTTFEEGKLVITTSLTTVYYLLENVQRYTHEGAMTNIEASTLRPGELVYMQNNDEMAFEGLPDGAVLDLYSIDGRKLNTTRANTGKRTIVSLAGFPTGTYILKCGDVTYKFVKR